MRTTRHGAAGPPKLGSSAHELALGPLPTCGRDCTHSLIQVDTYAEAKPCSKRAVRRVRPRWHGERRCWPDDRVPVACASRAASRRYATAGVEGVAATPAVCLFHHGACCSFADDVSDSDAGTPPGASKAAWAGPTSRPPAGHPISSDLSRTAMRFGGRCAPRSRVQRSSLPAHAPRSLSAPAVRRPCARRPPRSGAVHLRLCLTGRSSGTRGHRSRRCVAAPVVVERTAYGFKFERRPVGVQGKAHDCSWLTPGELWDYRQAKDFVLVRAVPCCLGAPLCPAGRGGGAAGQLRGTRAAPRARESL